MADDWRLTLTLADEGGGPDFIDSMRALGVEAEAQRRLGSRIAVSHDGPRIFLYADSEGDAREAERLVSGLLAERRLEAPATLERWHPVEEDWEPAEVPLPDTEDERRAEHERLIARERAESGADDAEWEVRVELPGHRETKALAEQLEADGIPVTPRWRYLLVGAADEDAARDLAERIRAAAPAGAKLHVELSGDAIFRVTPGNPFAIFGGMGG